LLQYFDILLCCPSEEVYKVATVALLTYLAEQGHKLPLSVTTVVKLAERPEPLGTVQTMQQFESYIKKEKRKLAGAHYIADIWTGSNDKPLPKHFFSAFAKLTMRPKGGC